MRHTSSFRSERRLRSSLRLLLVTSALVGGAAPAAAQALCVPPASGVPGLPGPPRWSGAEAWATIDDPRWRGAARQSFPNFIAATSDAGARALHLGNTLFLSLQVLVDPDGYTGDGAGHNYDQVFIGFRNPSTGASEVFQIDATALDAGLTHTTLSQSHWRKDDDATPAAQMIGPPAWASDPRLFVNQSVFGATIPWAVNLQVDLAAVQLALGTSSPTEAEVWYAFAVGHALSPVVSQVLFTWPSGTAFDPTTSPPTFAAPGQWAPLVLGTADPACTGVTIEWNHIETNQTPVSKIATDASNTFFARPDWGTTPIGADQIQARFRIANWGSQVGEDGQWTTLAGGEAVANKADGTIDFTCLQGADPQCPTLSASQTTHQCILVELSAKGASGVTFKKDSAYRNMDFGTASLFTREAEINIAGAKPFPGGTAARDVYLYVKTLNMPARVEPAPAAPQRNDVQLASAQRREPVSLDKNPYEALAEKHATYEVHVYHDTGRRGVVDGRQRRVLEAQVPFGYFITHDGPLEGWRAKLEGVGVTLTEIAPSYFHVSVPEGGSVRVKTIVEAIEPGAPQPWWTRCSCAATASPTRTSLVGLAALFLTLALTCRGAPRRSAPGRPRRRS